MQQLKPEDTVDKPVLYPVVRIQLCSVVERGEKRIQCLAEGWLDLNVDAGKELEIFGQMIKGFKDYVEAVKVTPIPDYPIK